MEEKFEYMRSDLRNKWEARHMRKCVAEVMDSHYTFWLEDEIVALRNSRTPTEQPGNSAMLKLLYDIKFYINDPHRTIEEGVVIDSNIDAVVAQLQQ